MRIEYRMCDLCGVEERGSIPVLTHDVRIDDFSFETCDGCYIKYFEQAVVKRTEFRRTNNTPFVPAVYPAEESKP